jgi:hypothetical protein
MGKKTDEIVKLAAHRGPPLRYMGVGVRSYPQGILESDMPDDLIACDAVLQVLERDISGAPGLAVTSRRGKTQAEWSPTEIFRAWYALGQKVQAVVDGHDATLGWMYDVASATNSTIDHLQRKGKLRKKSCIIGADGKPLLIDG